MITNDLLNSFILESRDELSELDKKEFDRVARIRCTALTTKIGDKIVSDVYEEYLDKSLDSINTLTIDANKILNILSSPETLYSVKVSNISISLFDNNEIIKIRPVYLERFGLEFSTTLRKIISGELDKYDIHKLTNDPNYEMDYKKKIVKSNLYNKPFKELLMSNNPNISLVINQATISGDLIPFVKSYDETCAQLSNLVRITKDAILKLKLDLNANINALEDMYSSNSYSLEKMRCIDKYIYFMNRTFLNLSCYITACIIKKISTISNNMKIIDRLCYSLTEDINVKNKKILEESSFDKSPYLLSNKSLDFISISLEYFNQRIKESDIDLDEILESSGLNTDLSSKFNKICTETQNTYLYERFSDEEVLPCLINEILESDNNMINLRNRFLDVKSNIPDLVENTNVLTQNVFVKSEIIDELNVLKENIELYEKNLFDSFDIRFNKINTLIESKEEIKHGDSLDIYAYDYSLESYMEAFDNILEKEEKDFKKLLMEYKSNINKKNKGILTIFEAEEQVEKDNKTPTVQNGNVDKKEDGNKEIKVDTEKSSGLFQKLSDFINSILDKFKMRSKKFIEKNNKWIIKYESELNNLDCSKVTMTLAKYEYATINNISKDITTAANKIRTINNSNIPTEFKEKGDGYHYLFPQIPKEISGLSSFPERLKHYYTYGTGKPTLTSYSGDHASKKIKEMIEFCKTYDSIYTRLDTDIKSLKEASKLKDLSESDVVVKVSGVVRDYTGNILTVIEKKYLDYIKILTKLLPNKNDVPEKAEEVKDGENNNQETK